MKKKSGLFVKINYKNELNSMGQKAELKHQRGTGELNKYLFCAGTYNKDGGTMIFRVNDIEEAKYIVDNNPFVNMARYSYEILSRNSIVLS